jgi:hypothetical protein
VPDGETIVRMSATSPEDTGAPIVALTGARDGIADAVRQALLAWGVQVIAWERGEDLDAVVAKADAVVVLDGLTATVGDYEGALDAIVSACHGRAKRPIVALLQVPAEESRRKGVLALADGAEARAANEGHAIAAVRTGVVVGDLDHPGPQDDILFEPGRWLNVAAPDAFAAPILMGDLTAIVATAAAAVMTYDVTGPTRRRVVAALGPQPMSVRALVAMTSPDTTVRRRRVGAVAALWVGTAFLAALAWFLARDSYDSVTVLAVIYAGVFPGLLVWRSLTPVAALPSADLAISGDPPERFGAPAPRPIAQVWTPEALVLRRDRRKRLEKARAHRRIPGARSISAFLVTFGVATTLLGLADLLFNPIGLDSKLAAVSVLVAGCTIAFGGGRLLGERDDRHAFALLAAGVATVTSLIFLLSGLVNQDAPYWAPFLFAYLLAASFTCAVVLYKLGRVGLAGFTKTKGVPALGTLVAGGALLTVLQFAYASLYVPSHSVPVLQASAVMAPRDVVTIGSGTQRERRIPLAVTVTLKNAGDQPVVVLSSPYAIYASRRAARVPTSVHAPPFAGSPRLLVVDRRMGTYARSATRALVQRGTLLSPGENLAPGEEVERRMAVYLAPGWDTASLRGDAVLARRFESDGKSVVQRATYGSVPMAETITPIEDKPLTHRLTRSPRYVHIQQADGYALPCPGRWPALHAYIDNDREPDWTTSTLCATKLGKLDKHYGLTYRSFADEILLRGSAGAD